jgi:hypothetical protein
VQLCVEAKVYTLTSLLANTLTRAHPRMLTRAHVLGDESMGWLKEMRGRGEGERSCRSLGCRNLTKHQQDRLWTCRSC